MIKGSLVSFTFCHTACFVKQAVSADQPNVAEPDDSEIDLSGTVPTSVGD